MIIRRAAIPDIASISRIINDAADYGLMLHRSPAYLYEHLRDYQVAVDEGPVGNDGGQPGGDTDAGQGGAIMGVCGLQIIWGNLAEICSLAVDTRYRRRGVGAALVKACVEEARQLGIRRVMSLTYEQNFFERLGFRVVDRQELPLKVWSQCIYCAKNRACDEIAMILEHADVADMVEQTPVYSDEKYVMPVTLKVRGRKTPGRMSDPAPAPDPASSPAEGEFFA